MAPIIIYSYGWKYVQDSSCLYVPKFKDDEEKEEKEKKEEKEEKEEIDSQKLQRL